MHVWQLWCSERSVTDRLLADFLAATKRHIRVLDRPRRRPQGWRPRADFWFVSCSSLRNTPPSLLCRPGIGSMPIRMEAPCRHIRRAAARSLICMAKGCWAMIPFGCGWASSLAWCGRSLSVAQCSTLPPCPEMLAGPLYPSVVFCLLMLAMRRKARGSGRGFLFIAVPQRFAFLVEAKFFACAGTTCSFSSEICAWPAHALLQVSRSSSGVSRVNSWTTLVLVVSCDVTSVKTRILYWCCTLFLAS